MANQEQNTKLDPEMNGFAEEVMRIQETMNRRRILIEQLDKQSREKEKQLQEKEKQHQLVIKQLQEQVKQQQQVIRQNQQDLEMKTRQYEIATPTSSESNHPTRLCNKISRMRSGYIRLPWINLSMHWQMTWKSIFIP